MGSPDSGLRGDPILRDGQIDGTRDSHSSSVDLPALRREAEQFQVFDYRDMAAKLAILRAMLAAIRDGGSGLAHDAKNGMIALVDATDALTQHVQQGQGVVRRLLDALSEQQGLEQRNQATLQSYLDRAELAEAEVTRLKAMVEALDRRLLDAETERS